LYYHGAHTKKHLKHITKTHLKPTLPKQHLKHITKTINWNHGYQTIIKTTLPKNDLKTEDDYPKDELRSPSRLPKRTDLKTQQDYPKHN